MSFVIPNQKIQYYYTKYINCEESYLISHWGSKENQEANFKQVANILKSYRPKTLLDVGSGMGSIQAFLPKSIAYTGIDIVPEVVEKANSPLITEADIKTYNPNKTFDAVVALGSFNMGVTHEDFMTSIRKMHELCSKISIVTASYVQPEEVQDCINDGWAVINNRRGSSYKPGDSIVFIKIK